jgi:hypothetical protein
MTESASENRSVYRLRWVGYGLLIFALIDTVQLLIPPGFTNPVWELQTLLGGLVDRVAVPLLGFALIFFGEFYDRIGLEKIALKILSWLCLVLAIVFLLMIPLGVINTARVDTANESQVNTQLAQSKQQLKQAKDQQLPQLVKQAEERLSQSDAEGLKAIATQLSLEVSASANSEELRSQIQQQLNTRKTQLQQQLNTQESQLDEQSKAALRNQRIGLFKNSVKWNLGALIASTLFFILWRTTNWAR